MRKLITTLALSATCLMSTPSFATSEASGHKDQKKGEQQIPRCTKRLGTVAVVEPDTNWWQGLGLGSPEAIIKMFVMKSGCFGLVDRGKGMQSRAMERAMADNGELQRGSNIGRAQVKAADYFIVPDIVAKNAHSGGGGFGGLMGGMLGGSLGGMIGGAINIKKKDASVMLTLVNARTTEQERMTEGYYRKTDIGFGGGGGLFGAGGFGGAAGGGYNDTDIGQVLVLAYLNAYTKLVTELGGLPEDASAAAPRAEK